jgi:alpha-tubulin suppressor-like RCC1 family protein
MRYRGRAASTWALAIRALPGHLPWTACAGVIALHAVGCSSSSSSATPPDGGAGATDSASPATDASGGDDSGAPSNNGDAATGPVKATALSGGDAYACAIATGGSVTCWGETFQGEVDGNPGESVLVPTAVPGFTGHAVAIATYEALGCAIVEGGSVQCWGRNPNWRVSGEAFPPPTTPTTVMGLNGPATSISVGTDSACAIVAGGLRCWGADGAGELGGGSSNYSAVPVQVTGLESGVTAVSVGNEFACAVVSGGVQCWGNNGSKQLGNASNTVFRAPIAVPGLASGVVDVVASETSACALLSSGTVTCWGSGGAGMVGSDGGTVAQPAQVAGLTGVTSIAIYNQTACALLTDGSVQCWGADPAGHIRGQPDMIGPTLVPITGLSGVATAVVVGAGFGCASIANAGVECWGFNEVGELGNGTTTDSLTPVPVTGL